MGRDLDAASMGTSSMGASSMASSMASGMSSTSGLSVDSDGKSLALSHTSEGSGGTKMEVSKQYRALENSSWLRRHALDIVQSSVFSNGILAIIVVNTIVMALQTVVSVNRPYGFYFSILDSVFLGIYINECFLKILAWGRAYFKSGWNNFDFFIVVSSIITWLLPALLQTVLTFNASIFRLLRLFRTVIVSSLLKSIPALTNILALAGLVLYIFAVIARSTYADVDPRRFGNMGACFFRLFQLMTLDNWSLIWMENKDDSSSIWGFLAIFIVVETFVFVNLFIAVIVNNLQDSRERMKNSSKSRKRLAAKKEEIDDLDVNAMGSQVDLGRGDEVNFALTEVFKEQLSLETFYTPTMPARQKELLGRYFMLLASLEHNLNFYQKQQKILDDLVDLVKEHTERQNEFNPNEQS